MGGCAKIGFVKNLFWERKCAVVKNTVREKVGKMSKPVGKNYVNNPQIPPHFLPQNCAVEKPVQNVEKSIPSTEKSKSNILLGRDLPNFFEKNRSLTVAGITCYGNKKWETVPVVF